jgi:hypothetical protein
MEFLMGRMDYELDFFVVHFEFFEEQVCEKGSQA